MALTPRLEPRQIQTQTLVMTPQMRQAINLLQMSNMELGQYIENELQQNPLLSMAEAEGPDMPADGAQPEANPTAPESTPEYAAGAVDRITGDEPSGLAEASLDMEVENRFDAEGGRADPAAGLGSSTGSALSAGESPDSILENTLAATAGLHETLSSQIGLAFDDEDQRAAALMLMEFLDEAGYFTGDLSEIAEQEMLDATRLESILDRLQGFDPPGIFARDLRECLALQLREKNRLDPAMEILLDNLDLLARGDLRGLSRRCDLEEDEIRDMIAEIRALDPKPGLSIAARDDVTTVVPDILMRKTAEGWWLELNPDTLPRLLIDREYYTELRGTARSKEDKRFVVDCLQSANWLVKALHQRATTILKVAEEITRAQADFFVRGVGHLRPLVLREVALAIDMHESTVSRVTTNKYIATPHGVFELKYFFTSSVGGGAQGGEAHSAESVKARIAALIREEPPDKTLSDDRLVSLLRDEGMDLARRTVAKYREALGIPSSVQRRRRKALSR